MSATSYQPQSYHSNNGTSRTANCRSCTVQNTSASRNPPPPAKNCPPKDPCSGVELIKNEAIRRICADEGQALPQDGKVVIQGACDIKTVAKGNTVTIFPLLDSGVAKFVVDAEADSPNDGSCTYSDLTSALKDAAAQPGDCPVTVLIMPGDYTVEGCLDNDKEINVIGLGYPQNSICVNVNATSCGNKGWFGVTFVGCNSNYILDNFQTHKQATDLFCKCTMTDDAGFLTRNDRLQFESCFFNYDQLTRDRPMVIEGGSGVFDIRNCSFLVCRLGGQDVNSFIWLEAKSTETISLMRGCHVQAFTFGEDDFFFIHLSGTQLFRLHHSTIEYLRAEPERTVLVGSGAKKKRPVPKACCPPRKSKSNCRCQKLLHQVGKGGSCDNRRDCKKCRSRITLEANNSCKKSHNNCQSKCSDCCPQRCSQETMDIDEKSNVKASLDFDHTSVRIDTNFGRSNIIITANLWSGSETNALHFAHGDFEAGKLNDSWLVAPDGTRGLWAYDKTHYHAFKSATTWAVTLGEGGVVRVNLNSAQFTVTNHDPVMRFNQNGTTGIGRMFSTNATFKKLTGEGGADPHWLENTFNDNEIVFNNFARREIEKVNNVGIGVTATIATDVDP